MFDIDGALQFITRDWNVEQLLEFEQYYNVNAKNTNHKTSNRQKSNAFKKTICPNKRSQADI
jgi:hypothetical protein